MNISIYNELLLFIWAIFLGYWGISAIGIKKGATNLGQWWAIRILIFLAILALARTRLFDQLDHPITNAGLNPTIGSIGVILTALGVGFAIWARKNLGRNWGMPMTIKEEPELVTSGPYQYVRHPIYTGVLVALAGSVLITVFSSGVVWVLILIIGAAYFVYSATKEEKVMTQKFPNQYPAYKARTKMLIPFIW